MANKTPAQSKTVWAGAAFAALGLADLALGSGVSCEIGGTGIPAGLLMLANGSLSVYLRLITKTEIQFKRKK